MDQRKNEPRLMCADMVEVFWRDYAGKRHRTMALLEDISASGACLQLEAPLPEGTIVTWRSPNQEFSGAVRYCRYREIGYFAGIEFVPSSKWSKSRYQPQHLFDPRTLVRK